MFLQEFALILGYKKPTQEKKKAGELVIRLNED